MHSGEISRREKQILFYFFRKWLKGLWDKISLCSSKRWERYLLIMFHSSHCALPLMECLPLAFQRQQPIKATNDSRWYVVRSFDSFCLFESDIFIPSPRIWGLFAFFAMPHARTFNLVSIYSCILTGNDSKIKWIWKCAQITTCQSRKPPHATGSIFS